MAENKRTSYEAVADYWDRHELSDENSEPVEVAVDLKRSTTYFPIDKELADRLKSTAARQGVSSQMLLNRWVQQKIDEEMASK
ncbi:MAG: CopG family antitoxin [Thermoanaerobaculia bacterium]|jgi:predicted HicB family RNase H-like nuclease